MQVSRILVLGYLVSLCVTVHIPIQSRDVVQHAHPSHKLNHHHDSTVSTSQVKTTNLKDTTKAWFNDQELTVDVNYGSKTITSVIDSTTFLSWVQSANPSTTTPATGTTACTGCSATPAQAYSCAGSCSLYKSPSTSTTPVALADFQSFNNLVDVAHTTEAVEKSVQLVNLNLKDQHFGLAYQFTVRTNDATNINYMQDNQGLLGLAYGSTYQTYEAQQNNEMSPPTANANNEPALNILDSLHKQNGNLVPERVFSLKLEQGLSILSLGETQNYFSGGEQTEYDNQGQTNWMLELNNLQIKDQPSTPAPSTTAKVQVVFTTASRFVWFSNQARFNDLATKIGTVSGLAGCSGTENVISCTCTGNGDVKKFPPLKFAFNKKDKKYFEVQPENYAYYTENKCQTYLQLLPAAARPASSAPEIIYLGQSFLYDNFAVFNMDSNKITLSPAYPVAAQSIPINQNSRTAILIVAALLFLAALGALLSLLSKVKYNPDAQPQQQSSQAKKSAVHTAPQQQSFQQSQNQSRGVPPPPPVNLPPQSSTYFQPGAQPVSQVYYQGSPSRGLPAQYRR